MEEVFPTHVGVFLFLKEKNLITDQFSPRTWGCFYILI